MKTKNQFRTTPLFSTIAQVTVLALLFFFILIKKESLLLVLLTIYYALAIHFLFLMSNKGWYDETISGICKYRICKKNYLDEDIYFLQSKPLLLPILPWRGEAYESFLYKKDFDDYLCDNHFKTVEEALECKNNLATNNRVRKLIFAKKIEVVI